MKKTIYLMLALLMTSLMSANAQVRIGGDNNPNESAILDLNESDKQTDGTKGLALPRVALTNSTTWGLEGDTPIDGMTVYNTSTSKENGLQGDGVYTWTGGATGEWKSPSLTRSSVTVVNGGAAIEGGEVVFYSKYTNAPAAFMMASPAGLLPTKDEARAWCASIGGRLPHEKDSPAYTVMPAHWSAYICSSYSMSMDYNMDYRFYEDGTTTNSGMLSILDKVSMIRTNASSKVPSYTVCVKDL